MWWSAFVYAACMTAWTAGVLWLFSMTAALAVPGLNWLFWSALFAYRSGYSDGQQATE